MRWGCSSQRSTAGRCSHTRPADFYRLLGSASLPTARILPGLRDGRDPCISSTDIPPLTAESTAESAARTRRVVTRSTGDDHPCPEESALQLADDRCCGARGPGHRGPRSRSCLEDLLSGPLGPFRVFRYPRRCCFGAHDGCRVDSCHCSDAEDVRQSAHVRGCLTSARESLPSDRDGTMLGCPTASERSRSERPPATSGIRHSLRTQYSRPQPTTFVATNAPCLP